VIGLNDWSDHSSVAAFDVMRHYGSDRLPIDLGSLQRALPQVKVFIRTLDQEFI
jgi:hypothetical protein